MSVAREYERRWRSVFAPRTGDLKLELGEELAEYFGSSLESVLQQMSSGKERFALEWIGKRVDPSNPEEVVRFYDETDAEVFELAEWYSDDRPHHPILTCVDIASELTGRRFLDYGSGIGSAAIVFGIAGFDVTIADVSSPLLEFAAWRCAKRGIGVQVIDLKKDGLQPGHHDVILCFDVLEHVPVPLEVAGRLREALVPRGLLFMSAPFGADPERPMHIVHDRRALDRVRAIGFDERWALTRRFPDYGRSGPRVFQRVERRALGNAVYLIRDVWLRGPVGDAISVALGPFKRREPNAPLG